MGALLGIAGSLLGKVLGAHLVTPGAAVSKVESAVTGLGVRYIGGVATGLYLVSPEIRTAVGGVVGAAKAAIGL